MSENGTGLELLGFLGGTAKSKEAEAQKKLDQYEYLYEKKDATHPKSNVTIQPQAKTQTPGKLPLNHLRFLGNNATIQHV